MAPDTLEPLGDADLLPLLRLFRRHVGERLADVRATWGAVNHGGLVPDLPPYQGHTDVILDFRDDATGRVSPVVLRMARDEGGPQCLGLFGSD